MDGVIKIDVEDDFEDDITYPQEVYDYMAESGCDLEDAVLAIYAGIY